MAGFLGRGWKFPVQVDQVTGRIMMSETTDDIQESIRIIIATARGERVMRPDFGCSVMEFLFGPTDPTTLQMLQSAVQDAIISWEPRVKDVEVLAELDRAQADRVNLQISYVIRATNNLYNLVYPFYLNEGVR
ncbi:MAG: GPW/gp25 family protein [Solirubrobacterales bacterium]